MTLQKKKNQNEPWYFWLGIVVLILFLFYGLYKLFFETAEETVVSKTIVRDREGNLRIILKTDLDEKIYLVNSNIIKEGEDFIYNDEKADVVSYYELEGKKFLIIEKNGTVTELNIFSELQTVEISEKTVTYTFADGSRFETSKVSEEIEYLNSVVRNKKDVKIIYYGKEITPTSFQFDDETIIPILPTGTLNPDTGLYEITTEVQTGEIETEVQTGEMTSEVQTDKDIFLFRQSERIGFMDLIYYLFYL